MTDYRGDSDHYREPRFVDDRVDMPEPPAQQDQDETMDKQESARNRARKRLVGALAAGVALIGFAAIAWYATKQGRENPNAVVPVITADNSPIRERPLEPGGLNVPNQDKRVFDRIAPNAARPEVERLMPPPEVPMARPAPEATAQPPSGPLVPEVPDLKARTLETPPPAAAPTAKSPPPAAAKPAPKAPQTAARMPAMPAGAFQVQLGAVRDAKRARAAAVRLTKAHRDVLGGRKVTVLRSDLGAKGTFYRLRVGPIADRGGADAMCAKFKARKVGCVVIKP